MSDNIRKRKENGGVQGPLPLPVPCALRGGPRPGLGNARHGGGDKADYCPPERGLVLGWGGGGFIRSQTFRV